MEYPLLIFGSSLFTGHTPTHPFLEACLDLTRDPTQGRVGTVAHQASMIACQNHPKTFIHCNRTCYTHMELPFVRWDAPGGFWVWPERENTADRREGERGRVFCQYLRSYYHYYWSILYIHIYTGCHKNTVVWWGFRKTKYFSDIFFPWIQIDWCESLIDDSSAGLGPSVGYQAGCVCLQSTLLLSSESTTPPSSSKNLRHSPRSVKPNSDCTKDTGKVGR